MSPLPPPNGSIVAIHDWPFFIPGLPASPTPGSQVAGAPCPAATSPTSAPVVAADEPAPSRGSGT